MSHANPAKKIINDPLKCADELFEGLVLAYDGKARRVGTRSIIMNDLRPNAPALLVGGGAGHEPIYHGLVGKGMADGAAVGEIFAAPPPDIVLEAAQAVNRGKGVLFLYGNYAGDVMNFDIGAELAADEGITVKTVIIADDVCSAPVTQSKTAGVWPVSCRSPRSPVPPRRWLIPWMSSPASRKKPATTPAPSAFPPSPAAFPPPASPPLNWPMM